MNVSVCVGVFDICIIIIRVKREACAAVFGQRKMFSNIMERTRRAKTYNQHNITWSNSDKKIGQVNGNFSCF